MYGDVSSARSMVFVVGAPRSGTTWLQLLLSQHEQVATVNETHLFSTYLGKAVSGWDGFQNAERAIGLHHHMTEEEFLAEIRCCANRFIDRLHTVAGADRPVFVEKTPAHVRHWRALRRLYPEASFVHVVRDPRAMVASMCRAGRGWGARWAAPGVVANAHRWRTDVGQGREAEIELGSACHRVYYETLWDERGPDTLHDCLKWLGLCAEREDAAVYLQNCRPENLRAGRGSTAWDTSSEPDGFVGQGGADTWRRDLSGKDIRAVEWLCRAMMVEFGYEPHGAAWPRKPWIARMDDGLRWLEWKARFWRARI